LKELQKSFICFRILSSQDLLINPKPPLSRQPFHTWRNAWRFAGWWPYTTLPYMWTSPSVKGTSLMTSDTRPTPTPGARSSSSFGRRCTMALVEGFLGRVLWLLTGRFLRNDMLPENLWWLTCKTVIFGFWVYFI